jgi:hypothetical protein
MKEAKDESAYAAKHAASFVTTPLTRALHARQSMREGT